MAKYGDSSKSSGTFNTMQSSANNHKGYQPAKPGNGKPKILKGESPNPNIGDPRAKTNVPSGATTNRTKSVLRPAARGGPDDRAFVGADSTAKKSSQQNGKS